MTIVKGKDVKAYVYRSGVPVLTVCATSMSKEETAEEIPTRQNVSKHNTYIGGYRDAAVTLEGAQTLDSFGRWQYKDWEDNIGEVVQMLLTYDNSYGDRYSYDAYFLIKGVSDTSDSTGFTTFSVDLKRSGAPVTGLVGNWLTDSDGNPILDSDGNVIR